jgi:cytochrome c
MKIASVTLSAALLAGPALAESHVSGDAAEGENAFRQCVSCHVVVDDDGNKIAGRAAKTGPNLYGVPGRTAGSVEDYRYSKPLAAAGEAGLEWTQESFVAYVQDPSGFLRDYLDDPRARGKMTFKVRKEEDAMNLWAYLVSVSPEVEMEAEVEATN